MPLIDRRQRERIVLVGVTIPPATLEDTEASLDELALLVDTAGGDDAARVVQKRDRPDPATFVGRGKAAELLEACLAVDADTVVFDNELTPGQQRNLEKLLGRTALDRTAVILDIFAQHAHSLEGKVQVELAQLRYRLPRLRGRGLALSQQAGGIGTRGPGETQLEVDRRRLMRRMTKLESDLRELTRHRTTQRQARSRSGRRTLALVGYTNAGKSTLLNRLTDAGVLVEDRLFATVDPTTRRLRLPGGEEVLVTDTVGFVRSLPHQLVEAFRSTLEEVVEADLVLHVVDASSPDPDAQMRAVRQVLRDIGADDVPELVVANKADLLPSGDGMAVTAAPSANGAAPPVIPGDGAVPAPVARLLERNAGAVLVSAATGAGIDGLLAAVHERLRALDTVVELVVPYDRGDVVAAVHRQGEVLSEQHEPDATRLRARLDGDRAGRFAPFRVR